LGTISDFTAQLKVAEYPLENKLSMGSLIPVISQYVTALCTFTLWIFAAHRWRPAAERVRKVVEEYNKISFARALRILPAFAPLILYSNNR
jgi:hypothetical protein